MPFVSAPRIYRANPLAISTRAGWDPSTYPVLEVLEALVPRRGEVLGEGPPKVPGVTVATPTWWQTVLLREYMNDRLF